MKVEEKQKKMAAAAALLEGRNADGLVSDANFSFLSFFFAVPTSEIVIKWCTCIL